MHGPRSGPSRAASSARAKGAWLSSDRGRSALDATLLIVEHYRNQRLLMEEELACEGFRTVSAANVAEALDRLGADTPDLVVLDLHLAGKDGHALLKRIAERHPRPASVIYTADASFHQTFTPRHADACVLKSSDLGKLVAIIRQLLAGRRADGQPAARQAAAIPA